MYILVQFDEISRKLELFFSKNRQLHIEVIGMKYFVCLFCFFIVIFLTFLDSRVLLYLFVYPKRYIHMYKYVHISLIHVRLCKSTWVCIIDVYSVYERPSSTSEYDRKTKRNCIQIVWIWSSKNWREKHSNLSHL